MHFDLQVAEGERPRIRHRYKSEAPDGWCELLADCWAQQSHTRPDFSQVLYRLQTIQRSTDFNRSDSLLRSSMTDNTAECLTPTGVDVEMVTVLPNKRELAGDDQIIVVENLVQDHTAKRQELEQAMIEAREALAASKQVVTAEVFMAETKEDKRMATSGQSGKLEGRFATELRVERAKKAKATTRDAIRTL